MALQAITIDDRLYDVEKAQRSFMNSLIFPNGCLPSVEVIARNVARRSDFRMVDLEDITPHYAETLRRWRANVDVSEEQIRALGLRRALPAAVAAVPVASARPASPSGGSGACRSCSASRAGAGTWPPPRPVRRRPSCPRWRYEALSLWASSGSASPTVRRCSSRRTRSPSRGSGPLDDASRVALRGLGRARDRLARAAIAAVANDAPVKPLLGGVDRRRPQRRARDRGRPRRPARRRRAEDRRGRGRFGRVDGLDPRRVLDARSARTRSARTTTSGTRCCPCWESDVVAVDMPGFGSAPPLGGESVTPYELAAALRERLPEEFDVAGISLGGWVALEMALAGWARSVTAIAPAGLWAQPLAPKRSVARMAARGFAPVLPRALAERAGAPGGAARDGGAPGARAVRGRAAARAGLCGRSGVRGRQPTGCGRGGSPGWRILRCL